MITKFLFPGRILSLVAPAEDPIDCRCLFWSNHTTPLNLWPESAVTEQFIDLKIQAECVVLRLAKTDNGEQRKALLHELRLVIAELDLEVEHTLPSLLGVDFITQMDSLGLP